MRDTNYVSIIAKIRETPKQKILNNNNLINTTIRAQIFQIRNTRTVKLSFWGNLANDIMAYYTLNDYIVIEGYLSSRTKTLEPKLKQIEITVLKVYPYFLNSKID